MSEQSMTDDMERVALKDCPIGLFWHGDTLCLKTEYGNNEGRIDAYIVETGEFFWGDAPQTIANQREQMVVPVDTDFAIATLSAAPQVGGITEEMATLADELEEVRNSVDAFNPDARLAALSAFDAAEHVWKMVPRIVATLRQPPALTKESADGE